MCECENEVIFEPDFDLEEEEFEEPEIDEEFDNLMEECLAEFEEMFGLELDEEDKDLAKQTLAYYFM